MSAAEPPQGANSAPAGGSAAAKPQAWGGHTSGDHIRKGLLGLFFVALLATPLVVKQMSTRNDPRFAADAKATALERHGFYFEEVARAAGIDFVHRAPTLDPQLAPHHAPGRVDGRVRFRRRFRSRRLA